MCAGQLDFLLSELCPRCHLWLPGSKHQVLSRAPLGHHCHWAVYWGRRKLLPWEEGRHHWFTSKGLFSPVQPSSDDSDKQQLCWHNAQPWQQPHKPFCSAGKAALHTSFYMCLNTTCVLMQTCALAAVTVPQPVRLWVSSGDPLHKPWTLAHLITSSSHSMLAPPHTARHWQALKWKVILSHQSQLLEEKKKPLTTILNKRLSAHWYSTHFTRMHLWEISMYTYQRINTLK